MVVVVGDGSVLFTCNWLGRSVLCAEKSSGLNRLEVEKRFFPGTLNAPGTRIYGCQARPRTVQTIPEVPRRHGSTPGYWGSKTCSKPGPPTPGSTAQITGTKIFLGSTRPVREVGRSLRIRALEASVIDILANSKIRLCSVKRMTQIQNTS